MIKLFYLFLLCFAVGAPRAQVNDIAKVISGTYTCTSTIGNFEKADVNKEKVKVRIKKTGENKVSVSMDGATSTYELTVEQKGLYSIGGESTINGMKASLNLELDHKPATIRGGNANESATKENKEVWWFEGTANEEKPESLSTDNDELGIKEGDLLTVPFKGTRRKATVLEITKEFVKWNVNTTYDKSGDVQESKRPQDVKVLIDNKEVRVYSEERAYLMNNRPAYKAGLVKAVWDKAKKPDGTVNDPAPPNEILTWDETKSRYAQWHMGHKPAYKYSKLVDSYINNEIDWEGFLKQYNTADNYRPELPSKNMGHEQEEAEIESDQNP